MGGSDGTAVSPSLVNVNGVLYGTVNSGGANDSGYVFKITASGTKSLVYSFGGGGDGIEPRDLINVDGVLYGTTFGGGAHGYGTVFRITTSGAESVLYSFAGGTDSANPVALANVNHVLYGTAGGGANLCAGTPCGTIFMITASGAESVLYNFAGGSDGAGPVGLTAVNGVLYGTTVAGGAICDCGTVFEITTPGAESVLYRFAGGIGDGAFPQAGLTNINGVLYGTTPGGGGGGGSRCAPYDGCGTVFSITTSGSESIIYDFPAYSDGAFPQAGLTNINGVLYGTTQRGGAKGIGTVFSLSL